MSPYRGWSTRRIKIQQCELPNFFPVVNILKDLLTGGRTLFCGAGGVYEPQLARDSTPCGVVSTGEKSAFVPDLLELMGYGRISGTGMEPYISSSGASEPPRPHWLAYILPGCLWLYELHSQSTISQCE